MPRQLRVFLCHASQDKPAVRELYKRLKSESWIDPWLDEEKLLGGQDFDLEIYKATRDADAIIICLSTTSVVKEGYVNKEIRRALEIAQEKGEGAIFVIPLRLDECNPLFEQLKKLHWVDYFASNAHEKLLKSLLMRATALEIKMPGNREVRLSKPKAKRSITQVKKEKSITRIALPWVDEKPSFDLEIYRFVEIPATKEVPYSFYIGKYPITNAQYQRFLDAPDFSYSVYWLEFPKFDVKYQPVGDWGTTGVAWLHEELEESRKRLSPLLLSRPKALFPKYWDDENFGKIKPYHPVVGISWYEANAYCAWVFKNWSSLLESKVNSFLTPQMVRLPLEIEWEKAAGGGKPRGRFPWDETGEQTKSLKEIAERTNISLSNTGQTTPVQQYPLGKSPYGVMDMSGNVWEWQANFFDIDCRWISLRGGSWNSLDQYARVSYFDDRRFPPLVRNNDIGFRTLVKM